MVNKTGTANDHWERLNRVLAHIQSNTDRHLSLSSLAAIANYSPFHFHRIFSAYIGESLHEHIRRVRLEKAALKLALSDGRVTQIALDAGYETPAAFTKAFKQLFGVIPMEYTKLKWRNRIAMLSRVPRGKMKLRVKSEILTLPPQKVIFVRKTGPYAIAAAEAWSVLMPYAYSHRMISKDARAIGISHDSPDITPEEKIRYDACITVKDSVSRRANSEFRPLRVDDTLCFYIKGHTRILTRPIITSWRSGIPKAARSSGTCRALKYT